MLTPRDNWFLNPLKNNGQYLTTRVVPAVARWSRWGLERSRMKAYRCQTKHAGLFFRSGNWNFLKVTCPPHMYTYIHIWTYVQIYTYMCFRGRWLYGMVCILQYKFLLKNHIFMLGHKWDPSGPVAAFSEKQGISEEKSFLMPKSTPSKSQTSGTNYSGISPNDVRKFMINSLQQITVCQ